MILLNPQVAATGYSGTKREMFPKLYDYDYIEKEYVRVRDISIELVNGDWEVQTDSVDSKWIYQQLQEYFATELELNEKRVANSMARIKAIKEVM